MNGTEIKSATTEKLSVWYANAKATYYGAGGHNKAAMNKQLMRRYAVELRRYRKVDPDTLAEGSFNGDGSY